MTIDAEYHKLKSFPSSKHRIDAAAATEADGTPRFHHLRAGPSSKHAVETAEISGGESETDELPSYTSLKDVMAISSPRGGDIAIRNELVKHAASAYVLSATITGAANRDRGSRMWERVRMCCLGFLFDSIYQLVRRIVGVVC